MSLILILIILFFSLIFTPKIVLAEEDYEHRFCNTIAYTIGELPTSSPVGTVEYDVTSIIGEKTTEFFYANEISTLTIVNGVVRLPNIGTHIAAPPGSRVDILYFYENKKSTTVNVNTIFVPMSSTEEISTSFSNITTAEPEFNAVFIPHNGLIFRRPGYYGRYPVGLTIPPSKKNRIVLGSIYVRNPIEVVNSFKKVTGEKVAFKIELKNTSNDNLEDLELLHMEKYLKFSIPPRESTVIEYELDSALFSNNINEELDLGTVNIKNNKEVKKCGIGDVDPIKLLGMYTHSVFYSNLTGGILGGSFFVPKPEGSFCITRIPYSMMIRDFKEESVGDQEEEEDEDGENQEDEIGGGNNNHDQDELTENEDILGSSDNIISANMENISNISSPALPDTGKKSLVSILTLLVADLYLWYSYFRNRKKYGSKNEDTKICSRCSKDSS